MTQPPSPREIGNRRVFGGYEIIKELGRGGMGVVYQAHEIASGREVALKVLYEGERATLPQIKRFHAEAVAVARLDHPHIVKILDVGQQDGLHYFTMELLTGDSFASLLKAGKLTRDGSLAYLEKIARALEYVHGKKMIHRDIKPANIMLDDAGEPRLADFGLAVRTISVLEDGKQKKKLVGTPQYLAPEQIQSEGKDATPAGDIYSLGVMLYQMLTGRLPYAGETPIEIYRKIVETDPVLPRLLDKSIPASLEAVCLKAIAKDMKQRYPSAAAFADDLAAFREGRAVSAPLHSTWHGQWRKVREHLQIAATGTLALLLLAGLFLLWLRPSQRERDLDLIRARLAASNYFGAYELLSSFPASVLPDPELDRLRSGIQDGLTLLSLEVGQEGIRIWSRSLDAGKNPGSERLLGSTPLRQAPLGPGLFLLRLDSVPPQTFPVACRGGDELRYRFDLSQVPSAMAVVPRNEADPADRVDTFCVDRKKRTVEDLEPLLFPWKRTISLEPLQVAGSTWLSLWARLPAAGGFSWTDATLICLGAEKGEVPFRLPDLADLEKLVTPLPLPGSESRAPWFWYGLENLDHDPPELIGTLPGKPPLAYQGTSQPPLIPIDLASRRFAFRRVRTLIPEEMEPGHPRPASSTLRQVSPGLRYSLLARWGPQQEWRPDYLSWLGQPHPVETGALSICHLLQLTGGKDVLDTASGTGDNPVEQILSASALMLSTRFFPASRPLLTRHFSRHLSSLPSGPSEYLGAIFLDSLLEGTLSPLLTPSFFALWRRLPEESKRFFLQTWQPRLGKYLEDLSRRQSVPFPGQGGLRLVCLLARNPSLLVNASLQRIGYLTARGTYPAVLAYARRLDPILNLEEEALSLRTTLAAYRAWASWHLGRMDEGRRWGEEAFRWETILEFPPKQSPLRRQLTGLLTSVPIWGPGEDAAYAFLQEKWPGSPAAK